MDIEFKLKFKLVCSDDEYSDYINLNKIPANILKKLTDNILSDSYKNLLGKRFISNTIDETDANNISQYYNVKINNIQHIGNINFLVNATILKPTKLPKNCSFLKKEELLDDENKINKLLNIKNIKEYITSSIVHNYTSSDYGVKKVKGKGPNNPVYSLVLMEPTCIGNLKKL